LLNIVNYITSDILENSQPSHLDSNVSLLNQGEHPQPPKTQGDYLGFKRENGLKIDQIRAQKCHSHLSHLFCDFQLAGEKYFFKYEIYILFFPDNFKTPQECDNGDSCKTQIKGRH